MSPVPVPYGMVPGQRHELPGITVPNDPPPPDDINLDESAPPAPYGMTPGVRHFLPGITPLLQQSAPPADSPSAPTEDESQYRDPNGHEYGVSFMLDGKRVNLQPNLEASSEHRGRQINDLGQALMKHAHTDAEKQAAERAAAWGLAQSDTDIPLEHVMKSMDESYRKDTGYEQALSKQLLVNQGHLAAVEANRRRGLGMGAGGPNLKQQKFEAAVVEQHADDINSIINSESQRFDFKKTQENVQAYQSVAQLMGSPNPGSQNLAEARALLALTGKQATARELQNIRMMDGALEMWANEVNRYFPDPQKTEGYRRQFIAAMNDAVNTAQSYQTQAAERSVARIKTQLWFRDLSPQDQALVVANVRGSMGGSFDVPEGEPSPAAQQAAPAAPRTAPKAAGPRGDVHAILGGK